MKKYSTVLFVGVMIFNVITVNAVNAEPYSTGVERRFEQDQDQDGSLLLAIAVVGLGAFIAGQDVAKGARNLKVRAGKAYIYANDNYWIPDGYDTNPYTGFQTRVNNTHARRLGYAESLQRRSETYRDLGKVLIVTGAMMLFGGSVGLTLSVQSSQNWTVRKDVHF
ncbi:MAG: hypothetical protein Q8R26_02325 [bacterium]|nr:hypothetical protein [bacterium]